MLNAIAFKEICENLKVYLDKTDYQPPLLEFSLFQLPDPLFKMAKVLPSNQVQYSSMRDYLNICHMQSRNPDQPNYLPLEYTANYFILREMVQIYMKNRDVIQDLVWERKGQYKKRVRFMEELLAEKTMDFNFKKSTIRMRINNCRQKILTKLQTSFNNSEDYGYQIHSKVLSLETLQLQLYDFETDLDDLISNFESSRSKVILASRAEHFYRTTQKNNWFLQLQPIKNYHNGYVTDRKLNLHELENLTIERRHQGLNNTTAPALGLMRNIINLGEVLLEKIKKQRSIAERRIDALLEIAPDRAALFERQVQIMEKLEQVEDVMMRAEALETRIETARRDIL